MVKHQEKPWGFHGFFHQHLEVASNGDSNTQTEGVHQNAKDMGLWGAFIFGAEKRRCEEASLSVETMEKDDLQKCLTRFNIYTINLMTYLHINVRFVQKMII